MNLRTQFLKFTILSAIVILSCSSSKNLSNQPFSGEIIYKTTILPKYSTVNLDSIRQTTPGDETRYMINDSFYKSSYFKNDTLAYSFTYDSKTKRMYDYYSGSSYITYRDSQAPNTEELDITIYKDSTTKILGRDAYLTIDKTYEFESNTYYSDAVKINYSKFKGHNVGYWFERLELTNGAISLKSTTDYPTHQSILEAVKITRKDYDASDFTLPDGLPVFASYSVLDTKIELVNPTPNQIRCYQAKSLSAPDVFENEDRMFTSYVRLAITKKGRVAFARAFEKDEYGIYEIAVDIMNSCNFYFKPGEINGEPVDSELIMPVQFSL